MIKIKPFDNMVVVKVLETTTASSSPIIMPDKYISRYVSYQLLAIGPTVSWKDQVKVGDIVVGNPTPKDEEIEPGIKLINSHSIFCRKEITSGPVN